MSWRSVVFSVILLAAGQALPALADSCLRGGCHQELSARKYLHGPVAAEQLGDTGCVTCHVPAGRACASDKAGAFRPMEDSVRMCQRCHARGTGTQHTSKKIDCLKCHNPHGSDKSPDLKRP